MAAECAEKISDSRKELENRNEYEIRLSQFLKKEREGNKLLSDIQ